MKHSCESESGKFVTGKYQSEYSRLCKICGRQPLENLKGYGLFK